MKAEIITIGDEILIGQIVDTNSAWIAARLNEAGFTVVRKLTVGDDRREIADAVEGAMRTADAVIVTGGLGPTKDDITKQTLAGIFGGEMVRDRETYERNGRILAARGIEYNELNREQATVPSSAEVLQNMHGTAPGMWFTRGGKAVVSLPGVPFEMKELMARINAVLRRSEIPDDTRKRLVFDKLEINLDSYELLVDGKKVDTPPKELELLYHLASTPNRVYTRNQLLDEVWGFDYFGDSRTVDVHVKRLREKLEGVSDQGSLKTVWGVGYKFEVL